MAQSLPSIFDTDKPLPNDDEFVKGMSRGQLSMQPLELTPEEAATIQRWREEESFRLTIPIRKLPERISGDHHGEENVEARAPSTQSEEAG
jgi:hypothetical protein